jgi:muramoyltetrapeptide carboxypeptidase
MVKPRAVRPGDRLAVVAPASPFDPSAFAAGLDELRALGFEPVVDDRVFARRGYVAGAPEVRVAALLAAWRDPAVAGLVGARGGYGSAHLLPGLDPEEFRRQPKVFVGSSDLTALLSFVTLRCGVVAFHGPMVAGGFARGAAGYDADAFVRAVGGPEPMGELAPAGLECVRRGEAAGPLFGGTLTQLVASLGTPFAFDPPPGHVLFLDEVGERPYRIDRMLTQLAQAGVLARAAAIVFGDLPGCDEPGGAVTARSVVADCLREFPGPVLVGFPSGHTPRPALTLPLGVRARVVATGVPRLVIEEAAVTRG